MPHMQIPPFRRQWAALVVVGLGLSPAAAVARQTQGNAYYEFLQARRLSGENDYERALAALQRAAAADPDSAEIKAEMALVHSRKKPVVRADVERYAKEALAIDPDNTIANRTEVFKLRDAYLPIVRLYELFGIEPDHTNLLDGLLMVVEADGKRVGIFVDELMSQQQVVIKSLESNFRPVAGLAGATMLGDGRVALILDVPGVISHFFAQLAGRDVGHAGSQAAA